MNARTARWGVLVAVLMMAPGARAADLLHSQPVRSPVDHLLAAAAAEPVQSPTLQAAGESKGMSPKVKSILLSLLVPGLGQYVAGNHSWAYVFFGTEAAIWGSYVAFQIQGSAREDRYEEFAGVWAGVESPKGHDDTYYTNVGRFMTYDAYRVVTIRSGEGDLYPQELRWSWPSDERRNRFLDLRAASEDSFHRRDFMVAAALLNRALSVIHAARTVSNEPPSLGFQLRSDPTGELVPTVSWQTRF